MANHKSALKRIRANKRRTQVRGSRVTLLRTLIKNVESDIANKDISKAKESFRIAESQVMKGVTKGAVNKNTASRKISRLSSRIKAISA